MFSAKKPEEEPEEAGHSSVFPWNAPPPSEGESSKDAATPGRPSAIEPPALLIQM